MDEDEPNPNRRALIGAMIGLPVAGGLADLLIRTARRHASREAAQIPARGLVDPTDQRHLPIEPVAEAVSDRESDR